MGVLSTIYYCNWPGCKQTIFLSRGQTFAFVEWEMRHSQTMHLCAGHKGYSAEELDEAISKGLRVLGE